MNRYLIVGLGAAGLSAAETIRGHDSESEVIVFSKEKQGYYSRPALAYYLSKEINEQSLFPLSRKVLLDLNISPVLQPVIRIDVGAQKVITENNQHWSYDRLLLAPGAKAVKPEIEGVLLDGVVYLDSYAQTKTILKKARRGKKAIVVGGGITALEIVEGLRARRMQVHFLLRGTDYWGRVLDPIESDILLKRLEHDGVVIHKHTEMDRILGKNGRVSGILTKQNEILPADMVAIAIGVEPNLELAVSAGIETQRGIKVDQYLETSQKGIFAAGDAAEVYDPGTNNWILDSLWPIARHQGLIAGENMAGYPRPYIRQAPLNVTRLAGLTTTIIGMVGSAASNDECQIIRGESESWQLLPDAVVCQNNFEVNRLRLMVGQDQILGAVLMGDQSLSRTLEDLITKQVQIGSIREDLISSDANLGEILVQFWEKWKINNEN